MGTSDPKKPHKHVWGDIAPESTPDDLDHDGVMWQWCVRCGALQLGSETFLPGPKQKKDVFIAEKKVKT